jgi:hypothetical protein
MNQIEVCKQEGFYFIRVNNVVQDIKKTMQDVVTWIEFNWPVGTRVKWTVMP